MCFSGWPLRHRLTQNPEVMGSKQICPSGKSIENIIAPGLPGTWLVYRLFLFSCFVWINTGTIGTLNNTTQVRVGRIILSSSGTGDFQKLCHLIRAVCWRYTGDKAKSRAVFISGLWAVLRACAALIFSSSLATVATHYHGQFCIYGNCLLFSHG